MILEYQKIINMLHNTPNQLFSCITNKLSQNNW